MMKKTNAYIPTFGDPGSAGIGPVDGDISTETMWIPIVHHDWGVKSGVNAHLRNDEGWRD